MPNVLFSTAEAKRRKVEEKVMDIPIRDCVVDITMCSAIAPSSRSVASVKKYLFLLSSSYSTLLYTLLFVSEYVTLIDTAQFLSTLICLHVTTFADSNT